MTSMNYRDVEQLTVPVRVETKQGRLFLVRRAPAWRKAVRLLLDDPRVKQAKSHPPLEMPKGVENTWTINASGIPFRCVVMYDLCPYDGTPPGYIGRVDVLCRTSEAGA